MPIIRASIIGDYGLGSFPLPSHIIETNSEICEFHFWDDGIDS